MTTCALPLRPMDSLVDDRTAAAARRLAEALLASREYQAYLEAARQVNSDGQVMRLVQEIRSCRASYGCQERGALQTQLEGLPVMAAYEKATRELRALVEVLNQAIGAAAGLEFIANVRPDRHG